MRKFLGFTLLIISTQSFANPSITDSCSSKTQWAGSIAASQHDPVVYLGQKSIRDGLGTNAHKTMFTFSAIKRTLAPGCHTSTPCLRSNLDKNTQLPVVVKITLAPSCSGKPNELFDAAGDDGVKQTVNGQLICFGVNESGSTIIADKCTKISNDDRLYWDDWN